MASAARWIRSGPAGQYDLHAACGGLALARCAPRLPIVLWARASAIVIGDVFRIEEGHFAFALIVPVSLAPGRRSRWRAWGLAPALSAYRHFGMRAYLDDDAIWLNGRRIGESSARTIGDCAVMASSFLPRPTGSRVDWPERDLESVFRARIEAQHAWEFENSWPSDCERGAIADALAVEEADAQ